MNTIQNKVSKSILRTLEREVTAIFKKYKNEAIKIKKETK